MTKIKLGVGFAILAGVAVCMSASTKSALLMYGAALPLAGIALWCAVVGRRELSP